MYVNDHQLEALEKAAMAFIEENVIRTRPCTATAVLGEALREANATRQQCEDCIEHLYSKPTSK